MDERELEAWIASRLHARFDGAQPPAALRAVVQDVPAPTVRRLAPSMSFAWLAVAAVVVVAVAVGLGLRWAGPGGISATDTPSPTPLSPREYIVLPPDGVTPSKASTSLASDAFDLRLRAVGIQNFSSAAGDAITFELPADVDDGLIRELLAATGEVSFVPLPPEDYGPAKLEAVVGEPLPRDEPVLFSADQVESSGVATSNGIPTSVHFGLRPAGAAALEIYTAGNVGGSFAVLVDGRVALVATVAGAVTDGRLEVTGPDPDALALLAAVVTSGTLPDEWQGATVPVLIPRENAVAIAIEAAASPDATPTSVELTAYRDPDSRELVAAWLVRLAGTLPGGSCTSSPDQSPVSPPCPAVATSQAIVDAVSGDVLESTFR